MGYSRKQIIKILFIYLLFLFAAVSMHSYFILSKTYFNETCCDSLKQISFFYPFLQRQFSQGNFFWSWEYGLGGDVFGQYLYYYSTSLFFWITMLFFKISSLTDIFQIRLYISIFKLFLSMIFMYHLLKYVKRSNLASILGSLINGGALYYVFHSLKYDFMVDGMVWLPLLILGFEKFVQEKKTSLFIFSVFLVVCSNFYLAFINSLYLGLYAIFKYFVLRECYSLKGFFLYYIKFCGAYLIGFCIAAFSFLPAVYSFLHIDRFYSDVNIPLLFPTEFYKSLLYHLFFSYHVYSFNNNYILIIVFPIFVFMFLFYGFFLRNKQAKLAFIFSLFVFGMYLLPFSYSMFNGFSFIQYRWLYLFVFTVAYSISFTFDEMVEKVSIKSLLYFGVIWTILLIAIHYKQKVIGIAPDKNDFIILSIAGIISILFVLRNIITRPLFSILLVSAVLYNMVLTNDYLFKSYLKDPKVYRTMQEKVLNSSGYGTKEEKDLFDYVKEKDSSFYRISWQNDNESFNAPLLYNYRGFSTYNSLLSGDIHKFFKNEYNTLQCNMPSIFSNVDNRMYIETTLGSKYYIVRKKDSFRPYGYSVMDKKGDYILYKNRFSLPIGYMYDSLIDLNTFHSLPIAARDQLLMRAAVIENGTNLLLPKFNVNQLNVQIIKPKKQNILFQNAVLNGNQLTIGESGKLIIKNALAKNPGENLVVINLKRPDGQVYTLSINGKSFYYRGKGEIYNYPKEQIVFNLTNQNNTRDIVIHLTPGSYILNDLSIQFNPYDVYEKLVQKGFSKLENITFTEQSLSGEIKVQKKGILFLSIPYSEGWKIKVDGIHIKPLKVNIAFVGIPLTEGNHKITMNYVTPYFYLGMIISLVTFFLFSTYLISMNRKRNNQLRSRSSGQIH